MSLSVGNCHRHYLEASEPEGLDTETISLSPDRRHSCRTATQKLGRSMNRSYVVHLRAGGRHAPAQYRGGVPPMRSQKRRRMRTLRRWIRSSKHRVVVVAEMSAKKYSFNENTNELDIDPKFIADGVSFAQQNNYKAIRIRAMNDD